MKSFVKEVLSELVLVFTGKSLDILIPPILFLLLYNLYSLLPALMGSLFFSIIFFIKRITAKDNISYAVGGLIGVIVAVALAYIGDNAANFFLPDIIGTSLLILATMISLTLNKPLAIWVSHITRGWDINWFYRKDVLPAYREVTIFWLVFFIARLSVEIALYITGDVQDIVVANIILGIPVLIGVLTISYVYGITRLRKMGGPGVDEFMNNTPPPYKGQRKGF